MSATVRAASLVVAALITTTAATAGSLFDEATYRPLASDNKAFRVGDLLTVQVFENSSASTSTDTGTRRKNTVNAELTHGSRRADAGLGVGGDFDGGGSTQRANRVLITLSVSVREVLANGDLRVAGEQLLVVNAEQQKVSLEGRVRPQDISDGNVVLSTRLADARITYLGEGEVSQRQQRAWWRKLIDWVGL
ncbi:flagellar basal body L-ring protein FlgH [Caenimonas koreensis DSM 17982]|uniref:Flagellar L-ring protein n=1 Tax=Caenimonas koreensis DSM 17982 TaxID=1121255 RepID=A0A844BDZ0_9BURK|nr:flagellar basal body L-ring protein FlgH [Caenimonas koreensis]MRD48691.1 flagellar basal body L-ring protein FlgH [Caenimonas koreensis DSM 17982]